MSSSEDMRSLLGPLALRSEFQGSPIIVDIEEMAGEFVGNIDYLLPFTLKAAGALLVLAHEMTKDQECRQDKGPLSEFLRHCRNAAGHNGFSFKYNEPRRLAQWGSITLNSDLDKTPLFKDESGVGLLSPGDPIRLLYDIEQSYPDLKA